jgi:hypothetical protein
LYAARRENRTAAFVLPELPDSLFGWVPVLYRITDEEVLASAGLDAYVVSLFRDSTHRDDRRRFSDFDYR